MTIKNGPMDRPNTFLYFRVELVAEAVLGRFAKIESRVAIFARRSGIVES
jgi:hypothetical protein